MQDNELSAAQGAGIKPAWVLAGLVLIAVALGYRYVQMHHTKINPLYGNSEQSPNALRKLLHKTPQASRLSLLLNLVNSPSAGLRYAVIDELGNMYHQPGRARVQPPPQVLQVVEQGLQDDDSVVRKRALEVLPVLNLQKGLQTIMAEINDPDPWQAEAASSLAVQWVERHRKSPMNHNLVPGLMNGLQSRDGDVVQFSTMALCIATGNNWHVSRLAPVAQRAAVSEKWLQWWQGKKENWKTAPGFENLVPPPVTRTQPCPNFSAVSVDGRVINRSSLKGRAVLLYFWGVGCDPCNHEIPSIEAVYNQIKGQNATVLGVVTAANGDSRGVKKWCREHGITFPQALADRRILRQFGSIEDVPDTVLIDPQGRITHIWQGGPRTPEPYLAALAQAEGKS